MTESPPVTTAPKPHIAIDSEALRELRQGRGETQASLAAKAGISFQYLWQLERGVRTSMKPPTFVRLCDALGLRESQRGKLRKHPVRAA